MGTTTPVGIFEEGGSPYGVLDMSGNVWEWTRRSHWKNRITPYDPTDGREDLSAGDDVSRVLRGGAFRYGADLCSRADPPTTAHPGQPRLRLGFRVVVVAFPHLILVALATVADAAVARRHLERSERFDFF